MKTRNLLLGAASMLAVGITLAYAAGSFSTLPIVAEQAFCASTVSGVGGPTAPFLIPPANPQGTTSGICGQTVPAGPPGLTGNEVVPADTINSALTSPTLFTQQPTTAAVPIILLDSGAFTYSIPNQTRANFTLTNPTNWLILDSAGTDTQVNVQLPGTITQPALNGQQVHITSDQTITTLNVVGQTTATGAAAVTVANAPTTLVVSNTGSNIGFTWIYDAAISTWFRAQ